MNMMTHPPVPKEPPQQAPIDTYDARQLIRNGVQSCIGLDDTVYYLRITRAGKLILTK